MALSAKLMQDLSSITSNGIANYIKQGTNMDKFYKKQGWKVTMVTNILENNLRTYSPKVNKDSKVLNLQRFGNSPNLGNIDFCLL